MKFAITLEQDEDGFIASMRKHGEPIPVTDVEEVEVAV